MLIDQYLSREEIREFTVRSDAAGARMLLANWAIIAATFTVVALWTNPLTILLAIPLLGGRQLGLAVLMHEAGHSTLFRTPWMNRFFGQWFAALPVLGDCEAYASSHREHHKLAGTDKDPDLPNYDRYPIPGSSFRRKLLRDVTGQTGAKLLMGLLSGAGNRIMMREGEGRGTLGKGLIANGILLGILAAFGVVELYLLWVAAFLTSYMLVARLRQVAEHGAVPDLFDVDPRLHTRTTVARWYERLLLCPNHVNYHLEHHLLASAPAYRLPALHRLLSERGFFDDFPQAVEQGYLSVFRRAVPELSGPLPAGG